MEHDFWHSRWENNQIGFHEGKANDLLVGHLDTLALPVRSRIFLPLCGKTRDIAWLLSQGYAVAGAELSELAIQQLFDDLQVTPHVTEDGLLKHYAAQDIDILVGDIFMLGRQTLGPVDAVCDRAALVALPAEMRAGYVRHVAQITNKAPQLLVTFEYDQSSMNGPPFAITPSEVQEHYAPDFDVTLLERIEIKGGFKAKIPATEAIWHLQPRG